jgi:hypothetical protein
MMNDRTCKNCKYSNTVEVLDPVWSSISQWETVKRMQKETGLDITKALQMKCHYSGAPQVVRKSDWCHQWSAKDA